MNEQLNTKHFRGGSSADADRRARTVNSARRAATPRQPAGPAGRFAPPPYRRFHPARELMICLGWLRLFQAIVAEGVPISEGPIANET